MKKVVSLFRKANHFGNAVQPFLRGAKKKKDEGGDVLSNDIVNIFKDKTDPELKPIDEYPLWLKEALFLQSNSLSTGASAAMHDVKPYKFRIDDVPRLTRQINKKIAKNKNNLKAVLFNELEDDEHMDLKIREHFGDYRFKQEKDDEKEEEEEEEEAEEEETAKKPQQQQPDD